MGLDNLLGLDTDEKVKHWRWDKILGSYVSVVACFPPGVFCHLVIYPVIRSVIQQIKIVPDWAEILVSLLCAFLIIIGIIIGIIRLVVRMR